MSPRQAARSSTADIKPSRALPKTEAIQGFRRLNGSRTANGVRDVAVWCAEFSTQPNAPASSSNRAPTNVACGLRRLDTLADNLKWRLECELSQHNVNAAVCHVLGLDHDDRRQQLRAIVSRAYAEADALADAYADSILAFQRALAIGKRFDRALGLLIDQDLSAMKMSCSPEKFQNAYIDAFYEQVSPALRWGNWHSSESLYIGLDIGFKTLLSVSSDIGAVASKHQATGRTKEYIPRAFLVLRLAEALAICTGVKPHYYFNDGELDNPWSELLRSVTEITAIVLSGGAGDRLLRNIRKDASLMQHRETIDEFANGEIVAGRSLDVGRFPTEGIKIDFDVE